MFKQLKSDIASKKFFALKRLGKNFAARSMMAFVVLIPLLVPLATCATRSQTANTTPGADVPNIAAVAAAETPKPSGADPYNPPADAPETSSDRGFNTEDFLHPDDGSKPKLKKAVVTFAPVDGPRHSNDYNVVVRINVPQNTDPVDRFVAYPYPMPLPIPRRPPNTKGAAKGNSAPAAAPAPGAAGAAAAPAPAAPESKPAVAEQAYDKMPSTRNNIRSLILQTGYTNRQRRNMAYPQGGWRWQMAYRNALQRCHRSEPNYIGEMYGFIDAMEPLCKEECEKFDELEEDRQRRYQTAFEEYQINRTECEYESVKKGYFPVEFNMSRTFRGVRAAAELKLGPGTWWITGTHKVTGLLYYWQMPIQVSSNQVENVELNWKNALMIQGGW
jgi:hypothetical protein